VTDPAPFRYRSPDEDSARWLGFPFRSDDIVISTRSKSGTTWVQMICALLVFGTPELPERLERLSPWLDWLVTPRPDVYAALEAQTHRRFIKTHTPLDGVPLESRVTYIVVVRHPLDMAVSLYHQGDNLNRTRLRELLGHPEPATPPPARPPLPAWVRRWIDRDEDPRQALDSLPGVLWHFADAWARREEPNVVLVHYDDLARDLEGEMRRLAARLGICVPDDTWPALVHAATFEAMRREASALAPEATGVLKDSARFFRRGSSGEGREVLTAAEVEHYHQRAATMAPPDMLTWLHRHAGSKA
jgi:aryl sulfotransferase